MIFTMLEHCQLYIHLVDQSSCRTHDLDEFLLSPCQKYNCRHNYMCFPSDTPRHQYIIYFPSGEIFPSTAVASSSSSTSSNNTASSFTAS